MDSILDRGMSLSLGFVVFRSMRRYRPYDAEGMEYDIETLVAAIMDDANRSVQRRRFGQGGGEGSTNLRTREGFVDPNLSYGPSYYPRQIEYTPAIWMSFTSNKLARHRTTRRFAAT
ncbi:hypothetical protein AB1N83_012032 [Pleurotus pulmonarius]